MQKISKNIFDFFHSSRIESNCTYNDIMIKFSLDNKNNTRKCKSMNMHSLLSSANYAYSLMQNIRFKPLNYYFK